MDAALGQLVHLDAEWLQRLRCELATNPHTIIPTCKKEIRVSTN